MKKRFFDKPSKDVFVKTTNYLCNEWLDRSDLQLFENMKKNNPRRYNVAGLGNWGISEGLIYENFEERKFEIADINKISDIKSIFGLDFGLKKLAPLCRNAYSKFGELIIVRCATLIVVLTVKI